MKGYITGYNILIEIIHKYFVNILQMEGEYTSALFPGVFYQ